MSISQELEKMEKYIQCKGKRMSVLGACFRVNKSGWLGFSVDLVRKYNLNMYDSANLYFSKDKIGIKFFKEKVGSQKVRHNNARANVMSYGIYIMGFIKTYPDYIGIWKLVDEEENKKSGTLVLIAEKR